MVQVLILVRRLNTENYISGLRAIVGKDLLKTLRFSTQEFKIFVSAIVGFAEFDISFIRIHTDGSLRLAYLVKVSKTTSLSASEFDNSLTFKTLEIGHDKCHEVVQLHL